MNNANNIRRANPPELFHIFSYTTTEDFLVVYREINISFQWQIFVDLAVTYLNPSAENGFYIWKAYLKQDIKCLKKHNKFRKIYFFIVQKGLNTEETKKDSPG